MGHSLSFILSPFCFFFVSNRVEGKLDIVVGNKQRWDCCFRLDTNPTFSKWRNSVQTAAWEMIGHALRSIIICRVNTVVKVL